MEEMIDGVLYVVGSPEHTAAKAARKQRMDAAARVYTDRVTRMDARLRLTFADRFDANHVAFLARDLVHVRAEIEQTIYKALSAASLVPVDTSIPRGAQVVETRRLDHVGQARIGDTLAGDLPRADVEMTADQIKLVNILGSYGYDLQELEHAAFAKIPLGRYKAMACAEMIARALDGIGLSGSSASGLTGLFNNALVTVLTLTNGEWTGGATAAEILADLAEIEQTIITQSKDRHSAGTLILPTTAEGVLRTKHAGTNNDRTIASYFFGDAMGGGTSRMLKTLLRLIDLDDATGTSIAAADAPMGIAYTKTPDVLRWPIPIMFEEEAPQLHGFEWVVPARARVSGVDVRRPLAMLYVENLD